MGLLLHQQHQDGILGEVRLVERAFGLGLSGLQEAVALFTEHLDQDRPKGVRCVIELPVSQRVPVEGNHA